MTNNGKIEFSIMENFKPNAYFILNGSGILE